MNPLIIVLLIVFAFLAGTGFSFMLLNAFVLRLLKKLLKSIYLEDRKE